MTELIIALSYCCAFALTGVIEAWYYRYEMLFIRAIRLLRQVEKKYLEKVGLFLPPHLDKKVHEICETENVEGEKSWMVPQRIAFVSPAIILMWNDGWYQALIFGAALALVFSFIHNGCYNVTRNKYEPGTIPGGFFGTSPSDTSVLAFDLFARAAQFGAGIMCFIIYAYLKSI